MKRVRAALSVAGASALAAGCAVGPATEIMAGGLEVAASHKAGPLVPGTPEYEYFLAHDKDPASLQIKLVRKGREVQALSGAFYEVRAMYTEGLVRSAANLADYHFGVKALPNSLTGYSLNAPPPGAPKGQGVPRLRYAQHTTADDPLFPSLVDGTKTLNPTNDPAIYFLGQGILKTAQSNGFPPQVQDVFDSAVSSTVVGSINEEQSIKLGASAAEALFNTVWNTGVYYTQPASAGVGVLAPVVQDRPLTDNTTLTTTRYYKWKFPFAADTFSLGNNLPLGRLILDIRVVDVNGNITDSGATQVVLQNGNNSMTVTVAADKQGLADNLDITLPK